MQSLSTASRDGNLVQPSPGQPANTDSTPVPARASSTPSFAPMLTNSYLPAVMQAVAYYVELLQYEVIEMTTIEPPFTIPQSDPDDTTPTKPISNVPDTTTTTKKPFLVTSASKPTEVSTARPVTQPHPTVSHAPGYYAPVSGMMFTSPSKMDEMEDESVNTLADKSAESVSLMSVSSNQFMSWFLQNKEEEIAPKSGM